MTVLCIGSLNVDHVYQVRSLPEAGETVLSQSHAQGLGGKGANMSIAAAKAGAPVHHCGAIGPDGAWVAQRLDQLGIDGASIATVADPTGHALIYVDDHAENMIVVHSGANHALTAQQIDQALDRLQPGDRVLLQNETNLVPYAAQAARTRGHAVIYAAAPFDPVAIEAVLPSATLIALNQIEAEQLEQAQGRPLNTLQNIDVLITQGAQGATYLSPGATLQVPAFSVDAVDTTGAGDTFLGTFVAGLDQDLALPLALRRAAAAAALQVTRPGAADAIPTQSEVDAFLQSHP